jgi:hypothetical protein
MSSQYVPGCGNALGALGMADSLTDRVMASGEGFMRVLQGSHLSSMCIRYGDAEKHF